MTKTISNCVLICLSAVVVVAAIGAPQIISDKNGFFSAFVNHELLNVLGVILAITLASAAQLHLTLNGIEERLKLTNSFISTRAGIRSSIYWLIALFLIALALVVAKPVVAEEEWSQTLLNGSAVVIIVWYVMVLISLTEAVFGITPIHDEEEEGEDASS